MQQQRRNIVARVWIDFRREMFDLFEFFRQLIRGE